MTGRSRSISNLKSQISNSRSRSELQRSLDALLAEVRACRICADFLPLGPRPILRARTSARLLIVGQAPGTRVHATGIPWNDPSGDRLRSWLDLSREGFYDESRIAIIPMGYCYPGRDARGGDLPPRKECAEHWLGRLLAHLPHIETTLLVGQYAQTHYLGARTKDSLTEIVRAWRQYAPQYFPLPHPSFRNLAWLKRNAWFEEELIPALRKRVHELIEVGE
ncbi:MAG: uracil-DNA glycosylase family protein [Candidatus Hydrogenedentes bacterium]|nr:uracil-DNA glycosylase family protein [Candidatus Hydrogenedentota bacterium]